MADLASFKAGLDGFQKQVEAAAVKNQSRMVVEVFAGLVQGNPVGNPSLWKSKPRKGYVGGASRRSWQIDVNGTLATTAAGGPAAAIGVATGLKLGDRVRISSESPYMDRLNQGWSRQAPAGWIQAVVDRVVAKSRREGIT